MALALALALMAGSCGSCETRTADGPTPSAASAAPDAGPAREPIALPAGPWDEAANDELAAVRLAAEIDAPTLVQVVRDHPRHAAAALSALRHASDAELALGPLATLAQQLPAQREPLLRTLVALSRRPPGPHAEAPHPHGSERLDPGGLRRCIDTLQVMSRDEGVARPHRALAVSALRGFARAGFVAPDAIMTDLDPSE